MMLINIEKEFRNFNHFTLTVSGFHLETTSTDDHGTNIPPGDVALFVQLDDRCPILDTLQWK